ncbi:MAG: VWA domain-containing protein [Pyrinomonadaceae bacterium]
MNLKNLLIISLLLISSNHINAQVVRSVPNIREPPPTKREMPTSPITPKDNARRSLEENDDDVIKIDSKLVQIDAVVLDKKGNIVTGLTADDFEIIQDGKAQKVDFFNFFQNNKSIKPNENQNSTNKQSPQPAANLNLENLKRTVALVVDDTCMSFESINIVRNSLLKFVNTQMQEGDLVGIFRTRSGNGILQQFTADKNILIKGIKSINSSQGLGCQNDFSAARADYTIKQSGQGGSATFQDDNARLAQEKISSYRRESTTLGTVKTLQYLVRGMQNIPGRKSMVLISEGLFSNSQSSGQNLDQMRRLINFANQSAVVIYAMNARGLFDSGNISAADEVLPFTGDGGAGNDIEKLVTSRNNIYRSGLSGLSYLAYSTGGTLINNNNDLNKGLARILSDQSGYYLLGYQPDESTLKLDSNFRKIVVRVKRPDLIVRHRFGFYGIINSKKQNKNKSEDSELYQSLVSPITINNLHLKFTPFIGSEEKNPFLRYVIHIDANDLTFLDQSDGSKKLSLDVVAVILDSNGKLVDEFNRTHHVRAKDINMKEVLKNGLTYGGDLNVKKPGIYQIRVAIRDETSKHIGTASQYIEISDQKDNSLKMSQIIISGESEIFPPVIPLPRKAEESLGFVSSTTDPAIRVFQAGKELGFGYHVYNAKTDNQSNKTNLTSEIKIYKDGEIVFQVNESPIAAQGQISANVVDDSGVLPLKEKMLPGTYVLQIKVKDLNNNKKTVTQSIDFEVVN